MAKGEDKPKRRPKTHSYPVLTILGAGYGAIYQPITGTNDYTPYSALQVGKEQGFWAGLRQYARNVVINFAGVDATGGTMADGGRWSWRSMMNGTGATALGYAGDHVAKWLHINRLVNRLAKSLRIKARWGA